MPLPAVGAAAYAAFVNALPAALPVLGAAAVTVGLVSAHRPDAIDTARLVRMPEPAAECIRHNIAALNTKLVAVVQPLYGASTIGVTLKRGTFGEPIMNVVIREVETGSDVDFIPLVPPQEQPDVIARMIAGC
jgi:hypothetical protein